MITTVTLNPSFDVTLEVESFTVGGVARASSERLEAAGKGVNVAQALVANGVEARALAAIDPTAGRRYVELLDFPGVLRIAPVQGLIRTNVALVEPAGVITKVNGPGPTHSAETLGSLMRVIEESLDGTDWLVLSGSLPPGCPDDTYAQLIRLGHSHGCRVALDAEGDALRSGVEAGPELAKPNRHELQALTGYVLETVGDVVEASLLLIDHGVERVLCSLGPDGAVLVTPNSSLHAHVAPLVVDSHVGAGDALLAGFLARSNESQEDALRHAVAWGTAACRLPGSKMPGPGDIAFDDVLVGLPDPNTPLADRTVATTGA